MIADRLVGRQRCGTATVADDGGKYPVLLREGLLGVPKSPKGQCHCVGCRRLDRRRKPRAGVRHHHAHMRERSRARSRARGSQSRGVQCEQHWKAVQLDAEAEMLFSGPQKLPTRAAPREVLAGRLRLFHRREGTRARDARRTRVSPSCVRTIRAVCAVRRRLKQRMLPTITDDAEQ